MTVKLLFITFCLLVLSFPKAFGQISFQRYLSNDTIKHIPNAVVQAQDSGYYIVGESTTPPAFNTLGFLTKTDKFGIEQWSKYYPMGSSSNVTTLVDIKRTSDENLIITGNYRLNSAPGIERDYHLLKLDTAGNILWQRNYEEPYWQRAHQIVEAANGDFIMGGVNDVLGTGVNSSFFLIRTNSLGDTIWTKDYFNNMDQYAWSLSTTADNGIVIVGSIDVLPNLYSSTYIIKTNALGDTLWTKTLSSPNLTARDVVSETDGSIVVAGYSQTSSPYFSPYLLKLDSFGNEIWKKFYPDGGTLNIWCQSMTKTTDDGYAMLINDLDSASYVIKTDSDGNELWNREIPRLLPSMGLDIQKTSDSGLIITGKAYLGLVEPCLPTLIKLDGDGFITGGLSEANQTDQFQLFPNPANDFISLAGNLSEIVEVRVTNINGKVCKTQSSNFNLIDVHQLSSGVYFLRIKSANNNFDIKFIIQ